jgi:hypothetical protein
MNVGLLMLEGGHLDSQGSLEVDFSINMVVHVTADKETAGLKKLVINPLDE